MLTRRAVALSLALSPFAARLALGQERVKIVATFSILADLVRQVGGKRVDVTTLVAPGGDAHVFHPSPADAQRVAQAALVVANGLGFEGWIDRLVKASGAAPRRLVASTGVKPRRAKDDGHGHGHGNGHAGDDPHAWQSVPNAKIYVANIRDALIAADPAGEAAYRAGAAAHLADLDRLDAEIRAAVGALPPERRRIVTTHESFGYLAAEYGLEIIAPKGVSTDAEASAKDVARIIRQIRAARAPAVFLENVTDSRLIERIARESGARVGGTLYSDSLSPAGGPAGTYIDMMRHNIRELTKALAV